MKQLIPVFILVLFLALLIGANVYLTKRFNWYFSISNATALYFIFASITVFMIGGLIAFTNTTNILGSYAYITASFLMGFMLYLLLSVNLIDILHFFIKAQPKFYGIAALVLAFSISFYGIFNSFNTKLIKLDMPINGITKEIKAMHLTDVHIGHFRGKKFLKKIVDETNKQNADVVLITGDLFDGKIRLSAEHLEPLKQLKVPIFFVEGNHDGYTGSAIIKQKLRDIGVIVLENQIAEWNGLQIIGLNHMLADNKSTNMHASNGSNTIKSVLQAMNIDESKPSILLHHSPDGIQYAKEKSVDLYLAGHTHAGQMFPVNFFAKLIFKYNKGLHDYLGTKIYVSQGAGTFGPPMRVATDSEITLITLKTI